jgi:hypothetical protein
MFQGRTHVALAAAGIALVAGLTGWAAWAAWQKSVHKKAVAAVVEDTTARLREALPGKLDLKKLEAHAAAADANLEEVKKGASRNRALADGAEHYVLTAREIFRRQAAAIKAHEKIVVERTSLTAHMGKASRRDQAWIDEAMRRKKKVEAQYFDYNLVLTGLQELLWGFPDARKRIAPYVPEAALVELGPAEDAYRRVQSEARQAASELQAVRRLQ